MNHDRFRRVSSSAVDNSRPAQPGSGSGKVLAFLAGSGGSHLRRSCRGVEAETRGGALSLVPSLSKPRASKLPRPPFLVSIGELLTWLDVLSGALGGWIEDALASRWIHCSIESISKKGPYCSQTRLTTRTEVTTGTSVTFERDFQTFERVLRMSILLAAGGILFETVL